MSHTIIRLQVHLPDNQIVYFNEGEEQVAINCAAQCDTYITAWFTLNAENFEARCYYYIEIPYHFVFGGKNCKWKVRKRGSDMVIVRMYKVNLTSEVFFLRLLLLHVKGALSYENLRTVNADYNQFLDSIPENDDEDVQVFIDEANRVRPLLNDNQRNVADAILAALNEEPNNENKHSRLFFMDGPAGCDKTFTYNYLITETRIRHTRTATAARTGIAATLLKNGCTLHGLFKLSVPILENNTCNVTPNSIHGEFLRQVSLFLLDEASMIPKHALSAIDKLLQDICNNNFSFGGKVILMGGDFRQILPVVKRGRPAEVVESCLKCSEHWQYVQRFSLTENMRVQIGEEEFCQWLLKLGSGTLPVKSEDPLRGCIEIPEQCFENDNESIVEKIFGGAEEADYANRAILTPTNVDSLAINKKVLDRLPGDTKIYLSSDSIETDNYNEIYNFPVESLNSLTPSGMPVHCLKLKIGAVVMLLINLDLKGGLCNGTHLMVRALHNNYIDGQVLIGIAAGNRNFVPRVQLAPLDSNLPFILKRRQFPVRPKSSFKIHCPNNSFETYLTSVNSELIFKELKVDELENAINFIKINKSPGVDDISSNIVANVSSQIRKPIFEIFI
nr:ATP-dependent DNA helicase pif1-like [Hydra vulgaris]